MEVRDDAWLHAPTIAMIEGRAERDRCTVAQAFVTMETERARMRNKCQLQSASQIQINAMGVCTGAITGVFGVGA